MKNGDTQKIKAITNADLNGKGSRSREPVKKMSGFGKFINVFGMVLLAVMLTYVGVNFARDGRIFQKPLLTAETGKPKNTSSAAVSDSGTYTYKKPTAKSTSGSKSTPSKNTKNSGGTKKPVTPIPTPDP